MKRSRIILSLYIGAISLSVATLSMSLAWYASSNHLRIESISITVDCDRQLAISTNPNEGYVNSLDKKDLIDPGLFTPVSSAHSDSWLNEKKDMPVFYDDTIYSDAENANTSQEIIYGYFSQKLYLKADDDVYVTVKADDTYIKPNYEFNKSYAESLYLSYQIGDDEAKKNLSVDEIKARLDHLVNSMRFSILITDPTYYDYIILDPNKTEETFYGGILDNNVDYYYDYFTNTSDGKNYERLYGSYKNAESIQYDEPLDNYSDYDDASEEPNAFNAKHKKGIKRINLANSLQKGLEIEKEKSYTTEDFEAEKKPFRIPVYKNSPREIVLSIYIEGWDLDSVNYTMGATFIANLGLYIEGEM